jgi:hypothetical protein
MDCFVADAVGHDNTVYSFLQHFLNMKIQQPEPAVPLKKYRGRLEKLAAETSCKKNTWPRDL